jgi:hypothetical protein
LVLEGRSKSDVARHYEVSRWWVQQLVKRYQTEGATAFEPHSRRPTTTPTRSVPSSKKRLCGCAKPWTNKATTPARPPSPNTSPATAQSPTCLRCPRSGGYCPAEALGLVAGRPGWTWSGPSCACTADVRRKRRNQPSTKTNTSHTSAESSQPSARIGADHLGHSKVSMTQDRYMTRGRVRTQVAELLDRTVRVNDE